MKRHVLLCILSFSILSGMPLLAEDTPATGTVSAADLATAATSDPNALAFGLGLGLGFESLPNAAGTEVIGWQKLALTPDIGAGEFGVGLDVVLHYRFNGGPDGTSFEIRAEDWIPSETRSIFDVIFSKIRYVRYGKKNKPLFLQFGSIDKGTLGNGFIMSGYRNNLFEPDWHVLGLQADIDGKLFDFPYVGVESMVANVGRWDLEGFRAYVRPLAWADIGVFKELQIGYTMVWDLNPHAFDPDPADNANSSGDMVSMWGIDLRLPLVGEDLFSLVLFADYANQNNHEGGQIGLGGQIISIFDYAVAVRFMGENFIPSYFDQSYDVLRDAKYDIYSNDPSGASTPARSSWFARLGLNILKDMFIFDVNIDGIFSDQGYESYPNMEARLILKEGVIADLSAQAWYQKKAITSIYELFDAENAIIGAKIGYRFGPAIISLVYDVRYDPYSTLADKWQVSSKLETSIAILEGGK